MLDSCSLRGLDILLQLSLSLHFIHLNIRSLIPKLAEVRHLVRLTKATVIAISETWLDGSVQDAEIDVDGFLVVR